MKELLKKTWDKVRDVLLLVIELPVMLIAVIAAALLHDGQDHRAADKALH